MPAKQCRKRNLTRTFVLLRPEDEVAVPRDSEFRILEGSGRIKEVEFTNNATSQQIGEVLITAFPNMLKNSDLPR